MGGPSGVSAAKRSNEVDSKIKDLQSRRDYKTFAVLSPDAEVGIDRYTPCHVVDTVGFAGANAEQGYYIQVMPIQSVDDTSDVSPSDLNNGCYAILKGTPLEFDKKDSQIVEVVMHGPALVSIPYQQQILGTDLPTAGTDEDPAYDGNFDTAFYAVGDGSIMPTNYCDAWTTYGRIGPVGHFKVMAPVSKDNVDAYFRSIGVDEPAVGDNFWLWVNMDVAPTTIKVRTTQLVIEATHTEGQENDQVWTFEAVNALPFYQVTGGTQSTGDRVTRTNSNFNMWVINMTEEELPAGEYTATFSREMNAYTILTGGVSGGGGGANLVSLVENDSQIFLNSTVTCTVWEVAESGFGTPAPTANTVDVRNDWQLDLGLTIPQGTRMMVSECTDGLHRPISIDGSWIARTTYLTQAADSENVSAPYYNYVWHQFDMDYMRDRGYGLSAISNASTIDILRTGTYTLSLTWSGYTHLDDTELRITDGTGTPIVNQLLNTTDTEHGGNVVYVDYIVTQSMLSSGGIQIVFEFCSPDLAPSAGISSFSGITTRVERTGD